MSGTSVRVLIADENSLLREALCLLLDSQPDIEIVAQTGEVAELAGLVAGTRPDLVLFDVHMAPAADREAIVNRLLHGVPATRVLIMSMLDHPGLVRSLLDLGVQGYLHKSVGYAALVAAVRAHRGPYQTVAVPMRQARSRASSGPALSDREAEVLTLVAVALSNRQIALRLGISEGTVKRHLSNVFAKLDAVSRLDAVNKAMSLRLIDSSDQPPLRPRTADRPLAAA
ncbi:response regulator transcription factor [Streptomyces sp. HNM0663]|uniref:Response regulator transcription factor n=1 Tax=Streptomyces chengmaiensis TaxID=3040919 RepID=A0ABT6HHS5_9ACTN|nr:response regulator transcription factor [Streptomyces chengmaiensis]MDH2388146.1 response regulator transcription factor [Streptomyces chengmaiensis]